MQHKECRCRLARTRTPVEMSFVVMEGKTSTLEVVCLLLCLQVSKHSKIVMLLVVGSWDTDGMLLVLILCLLRKCCWNARYPVKSRRVPRESYCCCCKRQPLETSISVLRMCCCCCDEEAVQLGTPLPLRGDHPKSLWLWCSQLYSCLSRKIREVVNVTR